MAGMLQILTYLLCFYLVIKGVEVLQIGITAAQNGSAAKIIGAATLAICIAAAIYFTNMQDQQAQAMQPPTPPPASPSP